MKTFKIIVTTIGITIALAILYIGYFLYNMFPPAPSEETVANEFIKK